MHVTKNVVRDLLALYLAGEASADTRAFVEAYLDTDPDLKREADEARTARLGVELPPTPQMAPTTEKQALDATRRLLKDRTSTLVVACVFTLLPLTFAFDSSGITFLLIRDAPKVGLAWWATAIIMWACHIWIRRRLKVSGL
jgi:anti-sigma factor RsiW